MKKVKIQLNSYFFVLASFSVKALLTGKVTTVVGQNSRVETRSNGPMLKVR